jgi:hypothetical protein
LVKTFWGWRYQQLPYGTIIFTSPAGHTYVITPAAPCCFPASANPPAVSPHQKLSRGATIAASALR